MGALGDLVVAVGLLVLAVAIVDVVGCTSVGGIRGNRSPTLSSLAVVVGPVRSPGVVLPSVGPAAGLLILLAVPSPVPSGVVSSLVPRTRLPGSSSRPGEELVILVGAWIVTLLLLLVCRLAVHRLHLVQAPYRPGIADPGGPRGPSAVLLLLTILLHLVRHVAVR